VLSWKVLFGHGTNERVRIAKHFRPIAEFDQKAEFDGTVVEMLPTSRLFSGPCRSCTRTVSI
jgi:hypothetical protein